MKEHNVEIKASDVKKLRDKTGAGMLDCKKALMDSAGDFAKAEKKLKELGLAAAAKRSHKATENGMVTTLITDNKAGILELFCETDFVARNKDFVELGSKLLKDVIEQGITDKEDPAITDQMNTLISRIKENMGIKRFETMDIEADEYVTDYIHGEGSLGVLVKFKSDNTDIFQDEEVKAAAFDCALHAAFHNPPYLDKSMVDSAYMAEQEEIFRGQVAALGKPANVVDNIVKGKIQKHYSEICFLQQPFVKDDKKSVEQMLSDLGRQKGASLSLIDYRYYKVGEEA